MIIKDMDAKWVGRILHQDVFILLMVLKNIGLMTGQHQQQNVVININVYANQTHVLNAQAIHIVKVVPIQYVHHAQKIDRILF